MSTQRTRLLDYLPGIFQESAFLANFLLPFEDELARHEAQLATLDRYFSPALAPHTATEPDRDFLSWLATWLALSLDSEWPELTRRRLLTEAARLYRWRGTVYGLKQFVSLYTGLAAESIEIQEGYWPSGMQIGVASRIGAFDNGGPMPTRFEDIERLPPTYGDYYVIETEDEVETRRTVYPAADVLSIEVDDVFEGRFKSVRIQRKAYWGVDIYHNARLTRHNQRIRDCHLFTQSTGATVTYRGDSYLGGERDRPYHFIVLIKGASGEPARRQLRQLATERDPERRLARLGLLWRQPLTPSVRATLRSHLRGTLAAGDRGEAKLNNLLDLLQTPESAPDYAARRSLVESDTLQRLSRLRLDGLLAQPLTEIDRFVDIDSDRPEPHSHGLEKQGQYRVERDRVRAILDQEKPAHTVYAVRYQPVELHTQWSPWQTNLFSTIGLDRIG